MNTSHEHIQNPNCTWVHMTNVHDAIYSVSMSWCTTGNQLIWLKLTMPIWNNLSTSSAAHIPSIFLHSPHDMPAQIPSFLSRQNFHEQISKMCLSIFFSNLEHTCSSSLSDNMAVRNTCILHDTTVVTKNNCGSIDRNAKCPQLVSEHNEHVLEATNLLPNVADSTVFFFENQTIGTLCTKMTIPACDLLATTFPAWFTLTKAETVIGFTLGFSIFDANSSLHTHKNSSNLHCCLKLTHLPQWTLDQRPNVPCPGGSSCKQRCDTEPESVQSSDSPGAVTTKPLPGGHQFSQA